MQNNTTHERMQQQPNSEVVTRNRFYDDLRFFQIGPRFFLFMDSYLLNVVAELIRHETPDDTSVGNMNERWLDRGYSKQEWQKNLLEPIEKALTPFVETGQQAGVLLDELGARMFLVMYNNYCDAYSTTYLYEALGLRPRVESIEQTLLDEFRLFDPYLEIQIEELD